MAPSSWTTMGERRRLEGNAPVRLDGAHVWVVETGSVALFLTGTGASGQGTLGYRRFLCGVSAGEAVLWPPESSAVVLLVAIEPADVVAVPLAMMLGAVGSGQWTQAIERWSETLGAELDRASVGRPPRGALTTASEAEAYLRALQAAYLGAVERLDAQNDAETQRRFDQRQRLNERVAAETLEGLVSIADAPERGGRHQWVVSPVLSVMGQLGTACGFEAIAPSGNDHAPTLQQILDATGARGRQVRLPGRWWLHDGEPMMATLQSGGAPVGLVAIRRGWRGIGYRAFFADRPPADVDAALAATIAPNAVAVTPPLGDRRSASAVLRWVLRRQGREFSTALLSGVGVTLVGMITPQATKLLFETTIPDGDRSGLIGVGAALLVAAAGGLLFDLARSLSLLRLAAGTAARLQLAAWDRLLDQGPSFFRGFAAGDLESRVNAVTQIRTALSVTALSTLIGAAASLLNLGLMFFYSPTLATAGLVIALVAAAVCVSAGVTIRRTLGPLQNCDGQLRGMLIQLIGAVPKLRIAGAETRAFAEWGRVYAVRMQLAQQLRRVGDRVRLVSAVLPAVATGLMFWLVAGVEDGARLSVGGFIAFSTAFGTFLAGVTALGMSTELLLTVSALWGRLRPILEHEPEVRGQRNPPGTLTGRLRIDHVTFRYRPDGPLTLDAVSLYADPGECIALVGPSGSGKSTIVNLLLRFELPSAGAVYLDDHDLKGLDILSVRQQMGVVSQENKILAGSIYDNITADRPATHDEVWEAAKAAGIDDEIRQMPMGLHTVISEGGTNISGGQRQRLLIARVLLRKPALLILDEATSALDNRSQAIVTESLNRLKVTRILIAHRLSTIRQAHRIYVVEAGRVVQHGTFEALMREEGVFARLMRRQVA